MQKSDWKKCKLGDTAIEIIDGDRGKQYPKNNELLPDGFCLFLSTKNLPDIRFDFSETQFISKEKDCALRKGKLQRNDIAFTTRGTLGHLAWFTDAIPYENIRINSGMVILRNQDCGIDTRFLFQQLASQYIQKQIAELRTGSAQPQLPIKDFLNLELYLPPLEEQKRIAEILGALDDKIELLQKQNKTLEDMAKAIFKSWFVDFDVVHAKQKGLPKADIMREYHLTDELYDLFPSDFENSSLGPIPLGWQVKTVQDVAKVVGGGTPSTKEPTFFAQKGTAIPWLTPKDLSGYSHKYISHGQTDITQEGLNKSSAQLMPPNSIVFSSRAPIGYIAISLENITTNQGFKSLVPQKVQYTEFLYQYLCYHKHTIENLGTGSTFKEVSGSVMKNISLCFPNDSILKVYEERNTVVNKKLKNNLKQIQTLTELRDTLLPPLISGKIRV